MTEKGRPVYSGEKTDLKKSFRKIWKYSQKYHTAFLIAGIFTAISAVLSLVTPGFLSGFVDQIRDGMRTGMNFSLMKKTVLILLVLYVAAQLLNIMQSWIMGKASQKMGEDLRNQLDEKIFRLPMAYLHRTSKGDTLSRITNDVDTLVQSISQVVSLLANAALMFIGSLVMMLITSLPLAFAAVLSGALGVWLTNLISRKSMPYYVRQQQDLGSLDGYIEEIYRSQNIVSAYNQEDASEERFDGYNQALIRDGFLSQALSGLMMPVSSFVSNLAYVAVCAVGGILVLYGRGTFGMIVGFLAYVTYFTQPISRLSQSMQILMGAAAAGNRIFSFLETEEPPAQEDLAEWNPRGKGNVTFDHIWFTYPDAEKAVIQDFSLKAGKGQKIAIVGSTGAGKTTLVNLLMRFYETDSGSIFIDGTDIKDLSVKQARGCFTMVLQDSWLFEGTLRENLLLHLSREEQKKIPDERLWQVMDAVGLKHFAEVLPDGFDTVLRPDSLSQGQKQQISIARAMLDDCPMMILDEATGSLDTRTEYLIQQAMDRLMEKRTSFVIAHRLSTIINADQILVMKQGRIIEQGTHEELMKQNGFYAKLYQNSSEAA